MRFGFVIAAAFMLALCATCAPVWADPINIIVPSDQSPLPMTGRVTFDNEKDFRNFTLQLGRIRRFHPKSYGRGEVEPLCAVPTTLLDSVEAANLSWQPMAEFLRNDPRVLCASWSPPPLPEKAYTLPNGGCKVTEDVCHIVRLDSVRFEVAPVRVVYRFYDTLLAPITVQDLLYTDPKVRPTPHVLRYRIRQSLGFASLYAGLSVVSLLAFVAVVAKRKRVR